MILSPTPVLLALVSLSCAVPTVRSTIAPAAVPVPGSPAAMSTELRLPRHPALSPDGSQVAFSHQGDLWVAGVHDGIARRLTAHDAYDGRPRWSADGAWIAFTSTRYGNADVFVMPAAGGTPERLTWHSESEQLYGWIDSERVLLGAIRDKRYSRRGRAIWAGYRDGRTPTLIMDAPALRPALSPDGGRIAYERGHGDPSRRAYRGPASSALWIYDVASATHTELTQFDGNDVWPMWGPAESDSIYFLSDRENAGNGGGRELGLWRVAASGGRPEPVFQPEGQSLRYPSMSADGSAVVAELGDHLALIDPATGDARELRVYGSYDPSEPEQFEEVVSSGASELAISPDGESIAFVAEGDVFVMRKHEKIKRAVRVTTAPEPEANPVWVEDGEALLFVSERDGNAEIYRVRPSEEDTPFYKSRTFEEERLTDTAADEYSLELSPNGKLLAWMQGTGRLVVGDPDTLAVSRVITEGFDDPYYSWSPDSRWLAFSKVDDDYNSEVYLALADVEGVEEGAPGYAPFNLSRHPDDDYDPHWSPDGSLLTFTSKRQLLDETDVYVCWLRKQDPEMTETERLEAEEEKKKAEKEKEKGKKGKDEPEPEPEPEPVADEPDEPEDPETPQEPAAGDEPAAEGSEEDAQEDEEEKKEEVDPVVIDFDEIRLRIERLTRREGNETALGFDADSEKVYFNATVGTRLTTGSTGDRGFFSVEVHGGDEDSVESDPVSAFTRHEGTILYTRGGSIVGNDGKSTTYSFRVRYRRDRGELRRAVMEQAWRVLDRGFYDPGFHGHDWAASLEKWRPIALAASTKEDFGEFVNWMLGEMNASHMGYRGGGSTVAAEMDRHTTGVLGVLWDDAHEGPGRRVAEVLKDLPAHRERSRLEPGDVVLAVNGESYDAGDNWHRLMLGTSGEDTLLDVRGADGEEREVSIRPTSYFAINGAMYRRNADVARAAVEEASGGKLGYIHIEAMGTGSLLEFERDLFHATEGKDGLLIDVRENGGGWTTDMVLTMLMVNDHAITVPRGGGQGYPQERRIFATWNKPVVVLCNENSYSNAEIFSWAIKTLGRGPVVGKQTYGAVISTGGAGLLDGSFVRLPLRGWYVNDGKMTNMEFQGCPPDYPVEVLPGDFAAGKDRQLEKAVEVGLGLLP